MPFLLILLAFIAALIAVIIAAGSSGTLLGLGVLGWIAVAIALVILEKLIAYAGPYMAARRPTA